MKKVIEVENLSFAYADTLVLKNVNLSINAGEFVGIIGRNGSGKSTFLKLILGELKPLTGKIIKDKNLKIGYVEQVTMSSDNTFPATVLEVVLLGLYKKIGLFKFASKKIKQIAMGALKTVGMENYANRQISNLSGGQQQKVLIAKALVSSADILILDEPTTGIDRESENDFMNLLYHINLHHKKTIIMVSHNFDKLKIANKIYLVEENTIKETKNVWIWIFDYCVYCRNTFGGDYSTCWHHIGF